MERSVDRLARYIIYGVVSAVVLALCWYFRSVLIYIIIAAVVSLLGKPVMHLLGKIHLRKKSAPPWLLAIVALFLILGIFLFIFTRIIPVVVGIVQSISDNFSNSDYSLPVDAFMMTVDNVNAWLISHFPQFGPDFKI